MAYEIFSPWKKVLPVYNDTLLINALMSKKRSPVDFIKEKYSQDDYNVIVPVNLNGWDPDPSKRPNTSEVRCHSIPENFNFNVKYFYLGDIKTFKFSRIKPRIYEYI